MVDSPKTRRVVFMQFGVGFATLVMPGLVHRASAASLPLIKSYRNPGCGCCENWAELLTKAGFPVTMEDDPALDDRRAKFGVLANLAGCHTAVMGEFIIEGHVPPEDILSSIERKPVARGLAVRGMPMGSTGMETSRGTDKYDVMLLMADGTSRVYASH